MRNLQSEYFPTTNATSENVGQQRDQQRVQSVQISHRLTQDIPSQSLPETNRRTVYVYPMPVPKLSLQGASIQMSSAKKHMATSTEDQVSQIKSEAKVKAEDISQT
jgi:hypothetical protein